MKTRIAVLSAFAVLLGMFWGIACRPGKAAPHNINVTIGASATAVVSGNYYCRAVVFQNNNASDTMYIGDSSTTTSSGIKLAPGASYFEPPQAPKPWNLYGWYVAGTQNDTLSVVCDDGQ